MLSSKLLIRFLLSILLLGSWLITHFVPERTAGAQTDEISWGKYLNLSNSPTKSSVDPFLLADPAGYVHLFWAEEVGDSGVHQADTLMYSSWDGATWSKPIDIFFAPPEGDPIISYPSAVLDDNGRIHLIWLTEPNSPNYAVYYSSVDASQAANALAWEPVTVLAADLTGTKYSIDIAIDSEQNLHVIYARVPAGDTPPEERAVTYIRSTDGGVSWSDPLDIFTIPKMKYGASDTRLLTEPPNNVYASWTMYNDIGRGDAVYFARSLDGGLTWDRPLRLAETVGDEYERDWNSLGLLGKNQLVAMWEGGWRAYRQAMYSNDGGKTWSDAVDTFPWLIGENGYAKFVTDPIGKVHVFLAQRIREGNLERGTVEGLWHSVWEGGSRWREPVLAGPNYSMLNPQVVNVGGNKIVAAWYTNPEFEIIVNTGVIENVPPSTPQLWPTHNPEELIPTQTLAATLENPQPVSTQDVGAVGLQPAPVTPPVNPGMSILYGLLPAILIIVVMVWLRKHR